jgi:gluconolactonase
MPLTVITLDRLEKFGQGVDRPEDVVVGRDGRVWASDQQCACAQIDVSGVVRRVGVAGGLPNGINMTADGNILIANYGCGPLQLLDPDTGELRTLCEEVEGVRLTTSNYPIVDRAGNIWCANSTFADPWEEALDGRVDGFLYRVSPDGEARCMADGIQFANGLALDADESHIYVCQTTGCNVIRYPIGADGTLGAVENYGPELGMKIPEGMRPDPDVPAPREILNLLGLTDGCGFDQEGNLWVTLVAANRIVAITPAGEMVTVIDDPTGAILRSPTNVTWGGPDLCDLYIGSIEADYVVKTRSPVPGLPLIHQR